jgi:diacylglycerol kinase family enzyme
VQGDGDIIAQLPVEIAIAPETLDLIVPNETLSAGDGHSVDS